MATAQYNKAYTSMAGCDIQATFAGVLITELQGISNAISRETAGSYTMGSANPRNFTRGKRGIAGTLVFGHYNRHAFYWSMVNNFSENNFNHPGGFWGFINERPPRDYKDTVRAYYGNSLSQYSDKEWRQVEYSDQILPFEIVLTAQNEAGAAAELAIMGVQIVNEAQGFSTDDVLNSIQMSYVARHVLPWKAVGTNQTTNATGVSGASAGPGNAINDAINGVSGVLSSVGNLF